AAVGTLDQSGRSAAHHADLGSGRGDGGAGAAPRNRRQLDDLPPPLFRNAAALAGAGPAAVGSRQRARPAVPAGRADRAAAPAAARSAGAFADERTTPDRGGEAEGERGPHSCPVRT